MIERFKVLVWPVFMKKNLFDLIMNYCQMKIEHHDLTRDLVCERVFYQNQPVIFTKEILNDYLINTHGFDLYVPFSNEKLKTFLPQIRAYDKKVRKTSRRLNKWYVCNDEGCVSSYENYLVDPDCGILACSMNIYNYEKEMMLAGLFQDSETNISYFRLIFLSLM